MKQLVILMLLMGWITVSCVSSKKHEALQRRYQSTDRRLAELKKTNEFQAETITELRQRIQILEDLRKELTTTKEKFAALQGSHDQLRQAYDNALEEKDKLITTYSEDMAAFSRELANKEKSLEQQRSRLDSLSRDIDRREATLLQLKEQSRQQQIRMDTLQSTITQALNNFSGSELSVREEGGKIYVSLSQELLFGKGSNVIDNKGRRALIQLAGVLRDQTNVNINVEGHTDSDGTPFRNWQLSVERATAVVQILTANGLNPERIIASGRAFYDPVAPNDTEENKKLNRRTEIILEPNLEILYELFNSERS
ncbi:OmpA family protein [Membranicola marinus]|uniref:OmpA family protein n=1 Tax=Membranihabitans marinus TaxID=1227546 RepID=A0A953L8G5_9BACT|nr:OmpA family protein [Membranihabitans marinus]MBY5957660.1 OmpA family protein [Membranihabitans marinus]